VTGVCVHRDDATETLVPATGGNGSSKVITQKLFILSTKSCDWYSSSIYLHVYLFLSASKLFVYMFIYFDDLLLCPLYVIFVRLLIKYQFVPHVPLIWFCVNYESFS
jgi:hypothetical protein